MHDRKRHDDQDKIVFYLAYLAACDHTNPVFQRLVRIFLRKFYDGSRSDSRIHELLPDISFQLAGKKRR
jgi:hypothetical protein